MEYTRSRNNLGLKMKTILLDLNYTLVSNSAIKLSPFIRQIEGEVYRMDLIEAVKPYPVILITARPAKYTEATLKSIKTKTGWQPDEAFFNDQGMFPPAFKKTVLERFLLTRDIEMIGVESNPKTRAMYKNNGIESCSYADFIRDVKTWMQMSHQLDIIPPTINGALTSP
jgi:hypothetical protein